MGFYNNEKNVDDYVQMAAGYDGRELIDILQQHLPQGSTVLELGMGPGVDLDILAQHYTVTGSDASTLFLDRYRESHPEADLLELDATRIDTERTFDCIYSNKVLHHLSKLDLKRSFIRQRELLNPEGMLMHSFWVGEEEEEHHGLRFVNYTAETLLKAIGPDWEVVALEQYTEMEDDDSLYLLLRKS